MPIKKDCDEYLSYEIPGKSFHLNNRFTKIICHNLREQGIQTLVKKGYKFKEINKIYKDTEDSEINKFVLGHI